MSLASLGGSTVANSYLTVAEADGIAATMLGTLKWNDAATTTLQKESALIQATLQMETLGWVGTRAVATPPLSWPRKDAKCGEKSYDATTVPREVELATFDMAEALLGNPGLITGLGSGTSGSGGSGELVPGVPNKDLKRLKLDVMELEWRDGATGSATVKTPLSVLPHLAGILGCLTTSVRPSGASWMVPVIRG
jgi:hypothetical protein